MSNEPQVISEKIIVIYNPVTNSKEYAIEQTIKR